jgi:ABC-type phosphate/phosphonate transport system substrate-binding protein
MPALIHCSAFGAHKAAIAALAQGQSLVAPDLATARSLRAAARRQGRRVSVWRIVRGEPQHRVTLHS